MAQHGSNLPAELIAIVAADPEVRSRAKGIVMALLDNIEWTIQWGSAHDVAVLSRTVVPAILRNMSQVEQSESDREAAEAYAEIRTAIAAITAGAPRSVA